MFSHTSFPSGENGTTLIIVNVLVTISFLNNWMMVVICITERMIHVSRNLKRSTDLDPNWVGVPVDPDPGVCLKTAWRSV